MRNPLQAFWDKIPQEDRKLIRLTVFACVGILVLSLSGLYVYTAYGTPPDATTTDSSSVADSANDSTGQTPLGDSLANLASDSTGQLLEPGLPAPLNTASEEEIAGLDSFDAGAHRELMRLAASKYDFTRAVAHAQRIASQFSRDPEFAAELGHLYLEAGHPDQAVPYLEKALKGKSDPLVEADLALATFRSRNAEDALKQIQKSLEKYPGNPQLLTHQAAMTGEMPDTSLRVQAYPLFQNLIRLHPRFAEGRYQYGRYLMTMGNIKTSFEQLKIAVQLDPMNPRTHARLGMAQFYLEQDDQAERSYRTALSINPGDYNTWYNLGELYLSQANESAVATTVRTKTREALEANLAALAIAPDLGPAHFRTGMILNGNNQYREAIQHLSLALATDPQSTRILLQLASAWESIGETAKAMDYLEIAHGIDPFHKVVADNWKRLKQRQASP